MKDRQPERSESGTKLDSLTSIKGRSSFNKSSFNSFTGGLTGGGGLSSGPSSLKEESSGGNKVGKMLKHILLIFRLFRSYEFTELCNYLIPPRIAYNKSPRSELKALHCFLIEVERFDSLRSEGEGDSIQL